MVVMAEKKWLAAFKFNKQEKYNQNWSSLIQTHTRTTRHEVPIVTVSTNWRLNFRWTEFELDGWCTWPVETTVILIKAIYEVLSRTKGIYPWHKAKMKIKQKYETEKNMRNKHKCVPYPPGTTAPNRLWPQTCLVLHSQSLMKLSPFLRILHSWVLLDQMIFPKSNCYFPLLPLCSWLLLPVQSN